MVVVNNANKQYEVMIGATGLVVDILKAYIKETLVDIIENLGFGACKPFIIFA